MIIGKHHFRGYVIDITADTKPEDVKWIVKKHPEIAKHIDYPIETDGKSNKTKSKSKSSK